MKNVLVLLPTYNEAMNIEMILSKLIDLSVQIPRYSMSVLVLDDNSPDGTGKMVKAIHRKNPYIRLSTGTRKGGLGKAYLRGFSLAISKYHPDVIIMMDADMSHDPLVIPALLESIDAGSDYAIGSRYVQGGTIPGNWPLFRIMNSRIANSLAGALTGIGDEVSDLTGGFKAIRTTALSRINLNRINANGYVFQLSLLYAFLDTGAIVTEVPIAFVDRTLGSSKLRTSDIFEFIYRAYRLNPDSDMRRVLTFGLVGGIGALLNITILTILVSGLKVTPLLAAAIAIEVSTVANFSMHSSFTFKNSKDRNGPIITLLRLFKFNVTSLAGAAITLLIFTALFKLIGINYVVSDLLAIATAAVFNYKGSRIFVWKVSRA